MSKATSIIGLLGLTACSGGGAASTASEPAEVPALTSNTVTTEVSCSRIVDALIAWEQREHGDAAWRRYVDDDAVHAKVVTFCEADSSVAPFACVARAPSDVAAVDACMAELEQARGRKTEPELQLTRLGKNAKAYFAETGGYVAYRADLTPTQSCCSAGGSCAPDAGVWAQPPWSAMEFSIDDAHMFQYAYESDASHFLAAAVGDTNCDGKTVTYELRGEVVDGNPVFGEIVKIGQD